MDLLDAVRVPLLKEALASPSLLSDIAGLEHYIAESYDSRSFVELLQNADDACASKFAIERHGPYLIVANNGREFTNSDLEALCRSASSAKSRGESIGYRGIGFKSVVNLANTIHILSGPLAFTFSRDRTREALPTAGKVPLIRIPHQLTEQDAAFLFPLMASLTDRGFKSAFVFDEILSEKIDEEFEKFDSSALLFLRNVTKIHLDTSHKRSIQAEHLTDSCDERKIVLRDNDTQSRWSVYRRDAIALAISVDELGQPKPLDQNSAVVHAFLPTHELVGFPVKLHGDVSTDPSRTRVVLDGRTEATLEQMATLYIEILQKGLLSDANLVKVLVPFIDPRMAAFQKRNFSTCLLAAIKERSGTLFSNLKLRPLWLNAQDFDTFAKSSDLWSLRRECQELEGLPALLHTLEARESILDEVCVQLKQIRVSPIGAAEILAQLIRRHLVKGSGALLFQTDWLLWPKNDGTVIDFIQARQSALDEKFVEAINEKLGSASELRRFIESIDCTSSANLMLPTDGSKSESGLIRTEGGEKRTIARPSFGLKKWRKAEQQVLSVLVERGWKVTDVSRQNLGYDLEGTTNEGGTAYVEVKSIDYPGQPFSLTGNEMALAQSEGASYVLAVALQTESYLEVCFISDPAKNLAFSRQCRQWLWECSAYSHDSERYPLE